MDENPEIIIIKVVVILNALQYGWTIREITPHQFELSKKRESIPDFADTDFEGFMDTLIFTGGNNIYNMIQQ
jgi:hypothetical protein